MSATDVDRWQFGITTLYHYIFVPLTLGLSVLVAAMETVYVRTKDPTWRRMTMFWGRLFVINVAMGVVTGIVQEFQFGMNWSVYSAYVGDIFGAPLAMEALLAFFLESTFIGVWVFGWDRLTPRLHLTAAWLVAGGSMAVGDIHPRRQRMDAASGRLPVQRDHRPGGAARHRRCALEPGVSRHVPAHDPRRAAHGGSPPARCGALASRPQP